MYAAGVIFVTLCVSVALLHSKVYSGQSVTKLGCTCTSDAGPQGMRRWSGELDGPLFHGRDDRSGLYTRNGIGLPSPLLFFLSLDFLDKLCRFSGGV